MDTLLLVILFEHSCLLSVHSGLDCSIQWAPELLAELQSIKDDLQFL